MRERRGRAGKSVLVATVAGILRARRCDPSQRSLKRDDGVARFATSMPLILSNQSKRVSTTTADEFPSLRWIRYEINDSREIAMISQSSKAVLTSAGLLIPLMSHFASADALSFSVTFSTATSLFSLVLMVG